METTHYSKPIVTNTHEQCTLRWLKQVSVYLFSVYRGKTVCVSGIRDILLQTYHVYRGVVRMCAAEPLFDNTPRLKLLSPNSKSKDREWYPANVLT